MGKRAILLTVLVCVLALSAAAWGAGPEDFFNAGMKAAGAGDMIAVLNGTLTAVLALGLQVPLIGIPVGLAIHGACYWLNKRDPYFFDALGRHIRQKPYLDA